MPLTNFERMIQLADEVFSSRKDINQLDVNEEVLEHLRRIHPATVSEFDDGSGPVAWLLLIPTTLELMNLFLSGRISERELYKLTPLDTRYETLYLCSAMVLEEYRRKGITKKLALHAIASIRKDHPIKALFVWTFSQEGRLVSEALARALSLPLYRREK
jgi:GNAT superfamily N-acetyltransferase